MRAASVDFRFDDAYKTGRPSPNSDASSSGFGQRVGATVRRTRLCIFNAVKCPYVRPIVVKFEEINIKFGKVRKSSRSTCNHDRYWKTLSILSILNIVTLLNFMQYNAVQQGSDYTA